MGESKRRKNQLTSEHPIDGAMDTLGGRVHVVWDEQSAVSPLGQLSYFAQYLQTTGVFDAWLNSCPLVRTSGNAAPLRDVLGTWLLSILAGHNRYAHITGLRSDGVAAKLLGMSRVLSEDSLRRAIGALPPQSTQTWLKSHITQSVQDALETPWILDMDTTIKPLYGRQEGAMVSYNPHKPGRPCHALHTYWVGNLRMVLDVQVSAGNAHSPKEGMGRLLEILDELPKGKRPVLVRADCAYGNEPVIAKLEEREQPYLFKLRQSAGVKKLLQRLFYAERWSEPNTHDQGWSATEDKIKLTGWSKARRVILLRRQLRSQVVIESGQKELELGVLNANGRVYEYAALITNTDFEAQTIAQLYRDRADAENGFDELKNQWGWGGYTTQDIERCQSAARAVALIYNWWSWYARSAKPSARMEAITSRPLLLSGVARAVSHANQSTLYITPIHGKKSLVKELLTNIQEALAHVRHKAEQFKDQNPFSIFVRYVVDQIIRTITPIPPSNLALG